MKPTYYTEIEIPNFGTFLALSDGRSLTGLSITGQKYEPKKDSSWQHAPELPLFATLATQLQEVLAGRRRQFDISYCFARGTSFQQKVWQALAQIPYGKTTSYSALAQTLGIPKSTRAVGAAIGRNPFLVLVPCHRVIGKSGDLGGFAAGLERKRTLLELESKRK